MGGISTVTCPETVTRVGLEGKVEEEALGVEFSGSRGIAGAGKAVMDDRALSPADRLAQIGEGCRFYLVAGGVGADGTLRISKW